MNLNAYPVSCVFIIHCKLCLTKGMEKMVCMWYIISTFYSHSSCWGLFRLWSLLWHCVDLQVGMSIPEEPAAFAFGVERLGTNLSLMQAYMVSQPI